MSFAMNGLYINKLEHQGNKILQNILGQIPGSVTTDYILFNITVPSNTSADIQYGNSGWRIAYDGKVTTDFHFYFGQVVRTGVQKGACKRVWLSLGGAENSAFTNINSIISNKNNPSLLQTLKSNFKAIREQLALIEGVEGIGVDLDYEEPGDVADALPAVVEMLYGELKCPFTLCPYMNKASWITLLQKLYLRYNAQPVIGVNLQCYSGGSGNDPAEWVEAIAKAPRTGITDAAGFVWPIQSMASDAWPTYSPQQMQQNLQKWKSQGGSFWDTHALATQPIPPGMKDYSIAIKNGIA